MKKRPGLLAVRVVSWVIPEDDALTGDLIEASAQQSRAWLWWQALAAVVATCVRDARQHPILLGRGIALGCAMQYVGSYVVGVPIRRLMQGWVLDQPIRVLGSHPVVMLWATTLHLVPSILIVGLSAGWVVGRTHALRSALVFATLTFVLTSVSTIRGWWILSSRMPDFVNTTTPIFSMAVPLLLPVLSVAIGGILGTRARLRLFRPAT